MMENICATVNHRELTILSFLILKSSERASRVAANKEKILNLAVSEFAVIIQKAGKTF
jgi:hypothetical protein